MASIPKIPAYRQHKASGQAVMTIPVGGGRRRDVYLGPFGSKESRTEYARIIAELATAATPDLVVSTTTDATVNEVLLAFWEYANRHYRRADGTKTNEVHEYRWSLKPVKLLYGQTLAKDFGPLALKTVRQWMIDAGWCRSLVNQRIGRVKRAFKWLASEQLVPVAVFQSLTTVAGLQRGRTEARETKPVLPVEDWAVRLTLPNLGPVVAAMVEVQRLTGMRPGEVCQLRPADIEQTGDVWVYRPAYHKLAYRGKPRIVAIGPKAQVILERFRPTDPQGFYFSPARAVEAQHAERSEKRATPLYPSHARRNAAKRVKGRGRTLASRYETLAYGRAVARGVERANADRSRHTVPDHHHGPNLPVILHWHPNQLRHSHATEVRRRFGLEAAQVALGHSRADVTQVYAERDLGLAMRVASEMG